MSAKEKQKKKPRRVNNNDMHVQCEFCKVNLKLDVSSTTTCKCFRFYYCSDRCKGKSEHGKDCDPSNRPKRSSSPSADKIDPVAMFKYLPLYGKSFEELLDMEDNPTACSVISETLTIDALKVSDVGLDNVNWP